MTKLILRVSYPEQVGGGYKEYSVEDYRWDCDISDMMDLFESLLLSAGFHQNIIEEYF